MSTKINGVFRPATAEELAEDEPAPDTDRPTWWLRMSPAERRAYDAAMWEQIKPR